MYAIFTAYTSVSLVLSAFLFFLWFPPTPPGMVDGDYGFLFLIFFPLACPLFT